MPLGSRRRAALSLLVAALPVGGCGAAGDGALLLKRSEIGKQLARSTAVPSLPPDLTLGQPAGRGPVVTPDQARRILRAAWATREIAGAQDNPALLAQVETGPARAVEPSVTVDDLLTHQRSYRVVRSIERSSIAVPYQSRYPAAFLAAVQTEVYPGSPGPPPSAVTELLLITRASADTGWRIAVGTNFTEIPLADDLVFSAPTPDPVHPGYSLPGSAYSLPPAAAFTALADYYQSWWNDDRPPAGTPVAAGPNTSAAGRDIAGNGQDQLTSHGLLRHLEYRVWPGPESTFSFNFHHVFDVACSAIGGVDRYTAPNAVFPVLQNPARTWFGPRIVPGAYHRVSARMDDQTCIVVGRDGPPHPLAVCARASGTYGWHGDAAQQATSSPRPEAPLH